MSEIIEKDGEDVEVFTREEIDAEMANAVAEKEEEINTIKTQNEEATKALEEQITAKDEEIKNVGSKDYNFKKLNEQKEALEERLGKERTETDEKIDSIKKEFSDNSLTDKINKLANGDQETAKKIKFYYDKHSSEEDFEKRLEAATILAGVPAGDTGIPGDAFSSGAGAVPISTPKAGKASAELKDLGADRFGLDKEELKRL